jgi:CheY-like chemotaxis protein
MIILVADDNALSRDVIGELLEGLDQVAEKFGFQQIFWYRTTLIDLHAQRPPTKTTM